MNLKNYVVNMLENPGEKLKKVIKILNIVCLACTALALFLWLIIGIDACNVYHSYYYISGGYYEFDFLRYAGISLIIAISYIPEYLTCLFLTGVADLIADVKKIKEKMMENNGVAAQ